MNTKRLGFRFAPMSICSIEGEGDQGTGGGSQTDTGGNTGGGDGNSGAGTTGDSGANNNGQGFDPSTFWGGSDQSGAAAPNGESAGGAGSDSGTGSGADLQTALTTQLQGLSFGDPVFDAGIAEQINQGDFSGVQERFNSAMQTAVRQSLAMNVQILRPFAEQLMTQMREEFGATLNGRDNNDTLIRDFPSAKDPKVAPVVKQIFGQALKNTNGNRELAVTQTKEMLRLMAGTTAGDLGLNISTGGDDDSGRQQTKATNWLDELTGR